MHYASSSRRPSAPRRVSARLLHALQNGRLLSLRTVVSAASKQDKDDDHRSTGGGSGGKPRGVANNAIVAVMPGELPTIEANRFVCPNQPIPLPLPCPHSQLNFADHGGRRSKRGQWGRIDCGRGCCAKPRAGTAQRRRLFARLWRRSALH